MLESASDGLDEWIAKVRDPADQASEGKRRMAFGGAVAEYEVAPLPDRRYAIRYSCRLEFTAGTECPWRAFATREACIDYFLRNALTFFNLDKKLRSDREAARRKIVGMLEGEGLWGFEEPEPER